MTEITLHKSNKLAKYSDEEKNRKMSLNHSLCVVGAEEGCKPNYSAAYRAVARYLASGGAVLYAAEDLPPEETLNNFSRATNIDVETFVKNGALTIMKYDAPYNGNDSKGLDSRNLIKWWQSEVRKKQKKKYRQVLIVDTCKPFTDKGNYNGLVDYECVKRNALSPSPSPSPSTASAAKSSEFALFSSATTTTVECICCFNASAITRIPSMPMLTSILFSHDNKIGSAEKEGGGEEEEPLVMQPLYSSHMQQLLRQSIDDILGRGTCNLVIKTMKLVYRMDEETVIKRPSLFAETLERLLGKRIANTVLANVLDKMKERIIKVDCPCSC